MVANIRLSYAEIDRVAGVLNTSVDVTLVPRMTEAKKEVDSLLSTFLVLEKSSPALQQQYEKFNTALTQATESIKGYAKQFQAIKESVQGMDADLAEKVNSSGN
ncbi:hypothetical protein OG233_18050 [Streptomyces sp. NBC_01218]|uniref:hypothetical protein n=1 Tax=unclassified Streptomyces TaxID=2593676 RepID=UPI0023B94022|nr:MULTISPECIES: hypothetical protein [unclassified Streptomyces]WEH41277.1 hypothetical protein PZB77_18220 [Streptomyces sp. AM 2-1-1]WSQ52905.1 hypothetical protein OG233_18050 [Streptomyces sp. NBC_01218]